MRGVKRPFVTATLAWESNGEEAVTNGHFTPLIVKMPVCDGPCSTRRPATRVRSSQRPEFVQNSELACAESGFARWKNICPRQQFMVLCGAPAPGLAWPGVASLVLSSPQLRVMGPLYYRPARRETQMTVLMSAKKSRRAGQGGRKSHHCRGSERGSM